MFALRSCRSHATPHRGPISAQASAPRQVSMTAVVPADLWPLVPIGAALSSTYHPFFAAKNAIDGNLATKCASSTEQHAWLSVHVEPENGFIGYVVVYALASPTFARWLGEFEIWVGDGWGDLSLRCGHWAAATDSKQFTFECGFRAHYVTLRQLGSARTLSIAELEVFSWTAPPASPPSPPPQQPPDACDGDYTFCDDFLDLATVESNWETVNGRGYNFREVQHNNGDPLAQNSNVKHDSYAGVLELKMRASAGQHHCRVHDYTSAMLRSRGSFRYGTLETRIKIAPTPNTWPGFWTHAVGYDEARCPWPYSGEVDMPEIYRCQDGGGLCEYLNIKFAKCSGGLSDCEAAQVPIRLPADFFERFHDYKMDWTPEYIRLYRDGRLAVDFDVSTISYHNCGGHPYRRFEHLLLLQFAVSGFDSLSADSLPTYFAVDYVRLSQDIRVPGTIMYHRSGHPPAGPPPLSPELPLIPPGPPTYPPLPPFSPQPPSFPPTSPPPSVPPRAPLDCNNYRLVGSRHTLPFLNRDEARDVPLVQAPHNCYWLSSLHGCNHFVERISETVYGICRSREGSCHCAGSVERIACQFPPAPPHSPPSPILPRPPPPSLPLSVPRQPISFPPEWRHPHLSLPNSPSSHPPAAPDVTSPPAHVLLSFLPPSSLWNSTLQPSTSMPPASSSPPTLPVGRAIGSIDNSKGGRGGVNKTALALAASGVLLAMVLMAICCARQCRQVRGRLVLFGSRRLGVRLQPRRCGLSSSGRAVSIKQTNAARTSTTHGPS